MFEMVIPEIEYQATHTWTNLDRQAADYVKLNTDFEIVGGELENKRYR